MKGFTPGGPAGGRGNGFVLRRDVSTMKGGIGPAEGSVSEGGSLGSLSGLVGFGSGVRQHYSEVGV